MKYIRTKDWVYNETKYKVAKAFVSVFEKEQAKIMPTTKTNFSIIAQADTIEELCDEFVFIDEFFAREHRLAYSLENALARCKYHNVDVTTLRGAIWTDKGLIYVAKMNEKGEQENILTVVSYKRPDEYGAIDVVVGPNHTYFLMYDSAESRDEAYAKFKASDSATVDKNIKMHVVSHNS